MPGNASGEIDLSDDSTMRMCPQASEVFISAGMQDDNASLMSCPDVIYDIDRLKHQSDTGRADWASLRTLLGGSARE
jgi:hypothetical protein